MRIVRIVSLGRADTIGRVGSARWQKGNAFDDADESMLGVLASTPVPTRAGFDSFPAFAKEDPAMASFQLACEAAIEPKSAEEVAKELGR